MTNLEMAMQQTTTPTPRSRLLPALAILLTVLAAGWAVLATITTGLDEYSTCLPESRAVAASDEPRVNPAERQEITPGRGTGFYAAPCGSRLVYEVKADTAFSMRLDKPGATGQQTRIGLRGQLIVHVLDRKDGEILTRCQMSDVRLRLPGGTHKNMPTEARRLVHAAESATLMRLGDDGTIRGYRFAPGLNGDDRNFLRGMFSAFSFPVAANAKRKWEATEPDATGMFLAQYVRGDASADDIVTVHRQKIRYTLMSAKLNEVPKHSVNGTAIGKLSVELGWLRDARVDERLFMQISMLGICVDVRVSGTLKFSELTQAAPQVDRDVWDDAWAPASGHGEQVGDQHKAAQRRRLAEMLEGVDLTSMLRELSGLLATGKEDSPELYEAWDKLQKLIALRPEVANEIHELLLAGAVQGLLGNMLLTAVGAAGHDTAQDVLMAVRTNSRFNAATRQVATIAMTQLAKPRKDVLVGLVSELRPEGQFENHDASALMLLGTLASRNGEVLENGQTALDSLVQLEARVARAKKSDIWLDALGNAGTPAIVPHVLRHLDHEDIPVRESAVHALREIDTPRAIEALLRKSRDDASEIVRARAVAVLARRGAAAARNRVRQAALEDSSRSVRRAAIQAIASRGLRDASSRQVIQRVAKADRDPQLREIARRMLADQG